MNSLNRLIYRVYKQFQSLSLVATSAHFLYNRALPWLKRETRPCPYRPDLLTFTGPEVRDDKSIKETKIAFVCDEMTYQDFKNECQAVYINPANWLSIMESFKPEVFFCESAWRGIDTNWRGRIYRNAKVKYENRRELLNLLDYCKRNGIKTVFWNKEDPQYFHDKTYNFVDTALKFDYIFTTARECVPLYRELGHTKVDVLMFGFSPKLFNPINSSQNENRAVFAGSWYGDQPERCTDMEKCFAMILQKGIELQIYNRHSGSANPNNKFPDQYAAHIHDGIEFKELSKILKQFSYAININTVKDSPTMFARRVFETMACNILVISNESTGLRQLFGNRIWFLDQDFDESSVAAVCKENVREVFQNHTYTQRISCILDALQIPYKHDPERVLVLYEGLPADMEICWQHFREIHCKDKCGWFYNGQGFVRSEDNYQISRKQFAEEYRGYNYFILGDAEFPVRYDIEYALKHFDYIEQFSGIRSGEPSFKYVTDAHNMNTIFKIDRFEKLCQDKNQAFTKYLI